MANKIERVTAYIDGFNLYFGLKDSNYRRFYWLNVQAMVKELLKDWQKLTITKYFTARISDPPDKVKRQSAFLEALQTLEGVSIYNGHFLSKEVKCRKCGNKWKSFEEKMTDVNIATEILVDAFSNKFDVAFVVSADSDLVSPIKTVKSNFPNKRIIVFFPPKRYSADLKKHADLQFTIGRGTLSKSQFSSEIIKPDGFKLRRPDLWK